MTDIEQRFLIALEDAMAQRGQRKGKLKKSPPAYGTDGYAVWHALMLEHAPMRASVMSCVMAGLSQPELYAYAQQRAPQISRAIVN